MGAPQHEPDETEAQRRCAAVALRIALWACLPLSALTAAAAEPDSDALRKFGYFGQWARDCAKPPGRGNPYMEIVLPQTGYPFYQFWFGSGPKTSPRELRNVTITPENRLGLLTDNASKDAQMSVLIEKNGNRIRTYESRNMRTGAVVTKDAVIVETGEPTPWFERCADRQGH